MQARVVTVMTKPAFAFGIPQPLPLAGRFDGINDLARNWDVMLDGKRFLGVFAAGQSETAAGATPQIRVVLNWFEELKQRVPTK